MRTIAMLLLILLAGCTNVRPPVDVSLIPNDCANQPAITTWLEEQSKLIPSDKEQYAQQRAAIRHRIWHLRYTCNPA